MKNTIASYILLITFFALILILWGISSTIPEPKDRTDSFSRHDKVMYGSYILFEMLEDFFPSSHIKETKQAVYQKIYLGNDLDNINLDLTEKISYIFINNSLAEFNENDVEGVLEFVEAGHTVFLSTSVFSSYLTEPLGIKVEPNSTIRDELRPQIDSFIEDSLIISSQLLRYFSAFDSENTEVLAYNHKQQPNLIKVYRGSGFFILSSTPHIFTNYHILTREGREIIELALSHLPAENQIWWDEFYKVRYQGQRKLAESPLQYIYTQKSLSWAFWLTVIGMVIYVLFEIKRTQRVLPINSSLPNSTVEFTRTIGRLYFESQDHKNIAQKKIKVFLAYIRQHYYLKTHSFTEEFMKTLAIKSGAKEQEIIVLCRLIDQIRQQINITEDELIELNTKIQSFYEYSNK